jgi:tetratricopeptide (TPR) repeat protein
VGAEMTKPHFRLYFGSLVSLLVVFGSVREAIAEPMKPLEACPLRELASPPDFDLSSLFSPNKPLQSLSIAYAAVGQIDKAFSIAERINNDPIVKAITLAQIAKYQPKAEAEKTLARATQSIQQFKGKKPREFLRQLATEYAALGQLPKALELVEPLSENIEIISVIVTRLIQTRQDKIAFTFIQDLPKHLKQGLYQSQILAITAVLNQATKDGRGAEIVPQVVMISDDCQRSELVKSISFWALKKQKDRFSILFPLAKSIQREDLQASALEFIMEDLLREDQTEAALRLAKDLPPDRATQVFMKLGNYYIERENPDQALQVLDQARAFGADLESVRDLLLAIIKQYADSGQREKATRLLEAATELTNRTLSERAQSERHLEGLKLPLNPVKLPPALRQ